MMRHAHPLRGSFAAYSLSALVLVAGVVVSVRLCDSRQKRAREQTQRELQGFAHEVTDTLERRFMSYELILRAAKGLLMADEEVIRDEWRVFADTLGVGAKPDGTFGLALVRAVPENELRPYEARIRESGVPDFTVHGPALAAGAAPSDTHYVIEYHEPAEVNRVAWGLDISTIPVNRAAYQTACDTGRLWMTPAFQLTQQQPGQLGVVLVLPVYRGDAEPETVEDRRRQIDCVIALSVGLDVSLSDLTSLHDSRYNLRFDGLDGQGRRVTLFETPNSLNHDGALLAQATPILPGPRWSVVATEREQGSGSWLAGVDREFFGGLLISLLLAVLVRIWTRTRANAERIAGKMTESLRESESRYRTLVNGAPVCIKEFDREGRFVSMNPAGYAMVEMPEDADVLGNRFPELVMREDAGLVERELERVLRGEPRSFQYRIRLASGRVVTLETLIVPVPKLSNGSAGMISVSMDVTERVLAESQLRESESRYRALVDGAPVCIKELDPAGRILSMNPAGLSILGLTFESEIVGQCMDDLVVPEDVPLIQSEHRKILAGETRAFQFRLPLDSGEIAIMETLVVPRRCTGERVCCMICVTQNVTERVRAEIAIRENEARLEGLTRLAPIGIYRADASGLVVDVSERLVELTGLTREEASQEDWSPFIHPDDYGLVVEQWDRMVAEHVNFDSEYRLRRSDGTWAWFHVQAVPERDAQGVVTGFVGSMADHTERRAIEDRLRRNEARMRELAEQAQAASRIKTEFLANMSHEIRTPMTAILGFAELLTQSVEPGTEAEDALLTIQRNGEHLLQIVNDVLNISKIEAGQLAVSRVNLDLPGVVGQVFGLLSQNAQASGTTLASQAGEDAPGIIATDAVRLRQVLLNLVSNAIKFTRDGTVRVTTLRGETPGSVVIEVTDTGIGIDPARVEQIFEPFVQGDSTTTRTYGGTGLGLSISRKIAEAMGGTLTADPDHRGGSRFVLTLENADAIENAAAEPETAPAPPALALEDHPCRVLLAEDSVDNQRLIVHHLQHAGHQVVTADDGVAAVELALAAMGQGEPFDLILMDMQMPKLDGYGATARLRSKGYTGRIVALTAHAMDFEMQRCLDAGCDEYATKPIPRQTLLDLIHTARRAA